MATLQFFFLVFFSLFLLKIQKGFAPTFFTTTTAKQFCHQCFYEAASDRAKINVFSRHPSYYEAIREDIMDWLAENWAKWNDEKPEWFIRRIIGMIPDDMIPKEALAELKENGRKGRRRSSVAEALILVAGGESSENDEQAETS